MPYLNIWFTYFQDLTNEKNRFNVQKYIECRSDAKSLEPSNSSSSILDGLTDGECSMAPPVADDDDDDDRNL